jgi:hypothetical protein
MPNMSRATSVKLLRWFASDSATSRGSRITHTYFACFISLCGARAAHIRVEGRCFHREVRLELAPSWHGLHHRHLDLKSYKPMQVSGAHSKQTRSNEEKKNIASALRNPCHLRVHEELTSRVKGGGAGQGERWAPGQRSIHGDWRCKLPSRVSSFCLPACISVDTICCIHVVPLL